VEEGVIDAVDGVCAKTSRDFVCRLCMNTDLDEERHVYGRLVYMAMCGDKASIALIHVDRLGTWIDAIELQHKSIRPRNWSPLATEARCQTNRPYVSSNLARSVKAFQKKCGRLEREMSA
jgi:hypothetical protein